MRHAWHWPRQLWTLRWSLLKKPSNLSAEEKQAIAALESEDEGFVHSFRSIIRQLVNIFDHSHSEAQAKLRLQQLRQDIHAAGRPSSGEDSPHSLTITGSKPCGICGKRAWASTGVGPTRSQGCGCCDRLEKNHDGIRSAATRQHYIQIYQAIKYLSLDIADFIEKGPQMAELPCV